METKTHTQPFSGTFIIGLLAQPLIFRPLIQQSINNLTKSFLKLHPNVIQRMSEFTPAIIILNPIDLPFSFLVEFTKYNLSILIVDDDKYLGHDITKISASLTFFLNMLEGERDGDALFFSRQLTVEGDTTIIVALRNILESENININYDINAQFPVFANVIYFIKNVINYLMNSADQNLDKIKNSIIYEVRSDINLQKAKTKNMESEIKMLKKQKDSLTQKIQSMRLKINKGEFNE